MKNKRLTASALAQKARTLLAGLVIIAFALSPETARAADTATFPRPGDQSIQMVVLGDSVMWGQGLLPEDKHYTLVADMLRSCNGQLSVEPPILLAHSGAIIGEAGDSTVPDCAGECPLAWPTILHQVDLFNGDANSVDLVVLDGGINDVGVTTLVNPIPLPWQDIEDSTKQHCYNDMTKLLRKTAAKFPNARIVVCGYYQIVSEETDLDKLGWLLMALGSIPDPFSPLDPIKRGIVENCRVFAEQSETSLWQAVTDMNNELGEQRIVFADPEFGPENAVFASQPKLFEIGGPPLLEALDPVAAQRGDLGGECDQCSAYITNALGWLMCKRASVGHPNKAGERAYANAIMAALGLVGAVWVDFSVPCTATECGNGSFESPFNKLALAVGAVPAGGTIRIKAGAVAGTETLTITKACVLEAYGGSVTIGR